MSDKIASSRENAPTTAAIMAISDKSAIIATVDVIIERQSTRFLFLILCFGTSAPSPFPR